MVSTLQRVVVAYPEKDIAKYKVVKNATLKMRR